MTRAKTDRERKLIIETLKGILRGLQLILGRNIEIVLHDLSTPRNSVVAIVNGQITGRTIGSSIISGPTQDAGLQKLISGEDAATGESFTILSDYKTHARNRELDSTSVLLRDESGKAYAAFCINADRTKLRELEALARSLIETDLDGAKVGADSEASNVDDLIEEIIQSSVAETGKPVASMLREDKVEAVRKMNSRGLFLIRSSVDLVAKSLGVSRFTIYNYLEELRSDTAIGKRAKR